jgi:hypothetical protein
MGCSADGECRVESCAPAFVDCNGDALGKSGAELAGSNGCERRFGVLADGAQPLRVPEATMNVDGQPEDWNTYGIYAAAQGCADCSDETDDKTDRLLSPASAPRPDDLIGYFRISWDSSNLFLLAEAYDDHVIAKDGDATHEDGVVLLFDGLNNRASSPGYGNDDNRIYIGVNGAHQGFNRPLQAGQLVPVTSQDDGPFCYRIEAQISWRYIVGFEGSSAMGQFPPVEGNSYGFDLSFNDWDPAPGGAEPVVNEHQNQSWWIDPGDAWWRLSQGFGSITLQAGGSADAGAQ